MSLTNIMKNKINIQKKILILIIGIFLINLVIGAECPSSFPEDFECGGRVDRVFRVGTGNLLCGTDPDDDSVDAKWWVCDISGNCQPESIDTDNCYNELENIGCCPYEDHGQYCLNDKCIYDEGPQNFCSGLTQTQCNQVDSSAAENEFRAYYESGERICGEDWAMDPADILWPVGESNCRWSKDCFCKWDDAEGCKANYDQIFICEGGTTGTFGSCEISSVTSGNCDESGVTEISVGFTAIWLDSLGIPDPLNAPSDCTSPRSGYRPCINITRLVFFTILNLIAVIVILGIIYYFYFIKKYKKKKIKKK